MLLEFLQNNQKEILNTAEQKAFALAGPRPSSEKLRQGLPIFFDQLLDVLHLEEDKKNEVSEENHPDIQIAKSGGVHGEELLRLGYTLTHVVHAYGAMCQSITEIAQKKNQTIRPDEFSDLNHCLDVAIAGAVVEFQELQCKHESEMESEHLGSLAHELRNALTAVTISLQMIESGKVGFSGSTGNILKTSLKRMGNIIDRSLTEVRLRVDPKINKEPAYLLQIVEDIMLSINIEAKIKKQNMQMEIDPLLLIEVDYQLFYSAVTNIIQNALKYTPSGGTINIRGFHDEDNVVIEVEDECGGQLANDGKDLFKPFVQKNENRQGLGLGLTIAHTGIELNGGSIEVQNLHGKGCIFKILLPQTQDEKEQLLRRGLPTNNQLPH